MTNQELVAALEREWDLETGFLGQLRRGAFDRQAFARFVALLDELEIEGPTIDRRMVSLIWFAPLFISWQRERCAEAGCDMLEFERSLDSVTNRVQELLGVP